MNKEEFLAMASNFWDEIHSLKSQSNNLYDYEKSFDGLFVNFGRSTFEGSLGKVSKDRRLKKTI